MGCAGSVKKGVHSPSAAGEAKAGLKAASLPAECSPELQRVLADLGLEEHLTRLRSLGVRRLEDVAALLVADLEEAGLSRVQVRQLQRAAQCGGGAGLVPAWPPSGASATAPGSLKASLPPTEETTDGAVQPELSDTSVKSLTWVERSERGQSLHPPDSEALDVLSAGSASELMLRTLAGLPSPCEKTPQDSLAFSAGSPTLQSVPSDFEATEPMVQQAVSTSPGALPEPPSDAAGLPAAGAPQPSRTASAGSSRASAKSAQPAAAPVSARRPPLPPKAATPVSEQLESTLLPPRADEGLPLGQIGLPVELAGAEPALASSLSGELSPDDEPDGEPDGPGGRAPDFRELMRQHQPQDGLEGGVGEKLPEALRRRLDQRSGQRAQSRGARASAPPYQQQIAPPPRSPPLPAQQRSASSDAAAARGRRVSERSARAQSSDHSPGEKGGRQMFDKNALRKAHRELFMAGIRGYRERLLDDDGMLPPGPDLAVCTLRPAHSAVRVFVRKRPLFEHEEGERGEFDVATILPGKPLSSSLVLHSCLFQADLKTPYLSHLHFDFDHVFPEAAQDHEVYRVAACELVRSVREGGTGTMFMFGQTGSGKTHTMTAIEGLAAQDLFEGAEGEGWLALQFIELCGNRCFDLLMPGGKEKRPELRLREHGDGCFAAEGAAQLQPKSAQELCAALRAAHARRATSATDANATSSRSHAVCSLTLRSGGKLTLADCAGTERRKDSMYHSRERQQEGAEINASLHALKECVRYAASRQRVPPHAFRASALTKVLSGAFQQGGAQLAVICTVSPCAMDAEHTLATLRTGAALGGRGAEREEKEVLSLEQQPREAHPKQWSPEQVAAWLLRAGGGRFQDVALPSNFTGQMLVRLTEGRCAQLCGGDAKRGCLLFDLLHQEIKRAELSRRPP